jgi:hypothetical protein
MNVRDRIEKPVTFTPRRPYLRVGHSCNSVRLCHPYSVCAKQIERAPAEDER